MPITEPRGVLEGLRAPLAADDPTDTWWLLLDCGCTTSRPYPTSRPHENPCSLSRLHCAEHPSAAEPPPMKRGLGDDEAWLSGVPEEIVELV